MYKIFKALTTRKQDKEPSDEIIMKCDYCKGKGYIKHNYTETDGMKLRYGAPKHYSTKENCRECNATGKIIRTIPRK